MLEVYIPLVVAGIGSIIAAIGKILIDLKKLQVANKKDTQEVIKHELDNGRIKTIETKLDDHINRTNQNINELKSLIKNKKK